MPIYEISKFAGGISDFDDRGISGAFKFGKNLNIRKQIDSLTCQQALIDEGLLNDRSPSLSVSPSSSVSKSPSPSPSASSSPTPSPSASPSPSRSVSRSPSVTPSSSVSLSPSVSAELTSVFRDLIRWFVKANNGYTYGFGSTGYIYRRDGDAYWNREYKDPDGAIKGAWEWYSNTGVTYLYWATDKILKRKKLPGLSNWNDVEVVASNLTSADWHTMRDAGGALMICNGGWLAMVGYDNSYTNEALDLIPGNIAKTIVERDGRSIIGTGKLLNTTKSINAAIDSEVPLAQVGDDGQLYYANMSDSMPIKRFPGGGKVNPGGVCNEIEQVNFFEWEQTALSWIDKQSVGNMSLWAVYNADAGYGGIYSFGRYNKNHPFVLNLDYALDATELGAITNVDGTTLVSYRDGSEFGVKAVDSTAKATGVYEGLDLKATMKRSSEITAWNTAEVYCKPLPEGASIEFWYKLDKNGDFIRAYNESGDTALRAYGETKGIFNIGSAGDIFEPRLVLIPNGNTSPEVLKIKVFFT